MTRKIKTTIDKLDTSELADALALLESMLPHIAYLGSRGQNQAHDLAVRAKRLLSPEPVADVAREIRELTGELRRIVDRQNARIVDTDAERQRQLDAVVQMKAAAERRKEEARQERIRLGATSF